MDDGSIGIAILGTGAMGAAHAAAWGRIAGVRVIGVFGRDRGRLRAAATACGAEAFTDAAALVGHPSVDAVDVCLPTAMHPEIVVAALDAGRHVFCETPLALHLADARSMLAAARRARRLLQVGLLMRSVAAYGHVKAAAESGRHGRLLGLTTWRLGSYLRPGAPDARAHYGDPTVELMTFDFDVAGWLMGRPDRLSATAVRTAQGVPGEVAALLGYADGRHATVVASGLMPSGFPFTVGFRALFEAAAFELRTVFEAGVPRNHFTVVDAGAPPRVVATADSNPFEIELRRFADCIRGRADPALLDADRAIEALILSDATRRALDEGHVVGIGP